MFRSSDDPPSLARTVARGVLAGLGGTAAMTTAQTLATQIGGGEPSMTPAHAAEKTLGIEPADERAEQRLNNLVHWVYGTTWGLARSVLAGAGLRGLTASTLHLGVVWGTALVMLPRLGVAPPSREWGARTLASDLAQHAVYAYTTGWLYDRLTQRAQRGRSKLLRHAFPRR